MKVEINGLEGLVKLMLLMLIRNEGKAQLSIVENGKMKWFVEDFEERYNFKRIYSK